jgi:uncharacterized protein (DUF2252 family)
MEAPGSPPTPASPVGFDMPVGKELRKRVPRSSHAEWTAWEGRDPAAILADQERTRVPELLPLRHERMAASPFGFYRGAAAVMAADLARTPTTGLQVQACGDAHLMNFGVFASPERRLVFDLNDFDETLPAPFEWDVKRLAASVMLAAREIGTATKAARAWTQRAVWSYRTSMRSFAQMRSLDLWYWRVDVYDALDQGPPARAERARRGIIRQAERKTNLGALRKLTEVVDDRRRFVDDPPLVEHLDVPDLAERVQAGLRHYAETLPEERSALLERYRFVDWARKVVGVGSVGTECHMLLLLGHRDDDPLFLQIKEADRSVLEPYAGPSAHAHQGERVVRGQRLTQAVSDIFLGWASMGERDAYIRQLRDGKGSATLENAAAEDALAYAELCGTVLARAHARTGDGRAIGAYLGKGDAFDEAVTDFALAYADQTERDHVAYCAALDRQAR